MPKYILSKYHQLPDEAYDETEEILAQMIAEIESVYGQAYDELYQIANDYLAWFVDEDKKRSELFQAGKIALDVYRNWRINKLLTGRHWFAMAETMANNLANSNGIAYSIINDYIPEVYAINGNWAVYDVEKQLKINTSFELYNEEAIERLIRDNPDLLPKASVNIPLDKRWNKQNMTSAVMQSILQGENLTQLSERLASVSDMNQSSAIRNARTMLTAAQNGGKQDQYTRLESMGIELESLWIATLDFHTRESHRKMDGLTAKVGERFPNGLLYPGDVSSGNPAELYNCRCDYRTIAKGADFSKFERFSRLGDMSYDDWKTAHGGEPEFKAARNANRDKRMWKEYKTLLGKNVPQKFKDFQELKYKNTGEWKKMVSDARKSRNRRKRDGK